MFLATLSLVKIRQAEGDACQNGVRFHSFFTFSFPEKEKEKETLIETDT